MKRLSDPSTSETLKKFAMAMWKSPRRLFRGRLGCTRPPPTDIASETIAVDIEMPPAEAEAGAGHKAGPGGGELPMTSQRPSAELSTPLPTLHETIEWFVRGIGSTTTKKKLG